MHYNTVIYKQYAALYARLNDKVVGRTKLDKTQRMIGLLCVYRDELTYKHFLRY